MRFIKRITCSIFFAGILLIAPTQLFAQADPCTDPADPCPIDTNMIVLMAGAVVIAAKKAYHHKKVSL